MADFPAMFDNTEGSRPLETNHSPLEGIPPQNFESIEHLGAMWVRRLNLNKVKPD